MMTRPSIPHTRNASILWFALLSLLPSLSGQILISRWDFNAATLAPQTGIGEARLIGGTSATFAAGFNGEASGAWNVKGFPAQGTLPASAGVEFSLSTEGHSGVGLSFQLRHSNTSANLERVLWSTDGQNFTEAAAFRVNPAVTGTGETWYQRAVELPPATAGQAFLAVRIVSDFDTGAEGRYMASRLGSSYSTSGTWRFDNVTFSAVPEPGEYAAVTAIALMGSAAWRRIKPRHSKPALESGACNR